MSRFKYLLVASILTASPVHMAGAQRATLMVSARVLPAADVLAAGLLAPRVETGHTMVASARMDAPRAPAPVVSGKVVNSGKDFVEFNLGVAVAANVRYTVGVSAGQLSLPSSSRTGAQGRQEVTYRVPTTPGEKVPTSVTVTLTAGSIS
jgi:hypothetical protein